MTNYLHLDFETFSELTIAHGTHRYLSHPTTRVLLTAWALNDDPVQVEESPRVSDKLLQLLYARDVIIVAFNAEFERLALKYTLGLADLPPSKFMCTMAMTWSLSFAGGLEKVGQQIGLTEDVAKADARRVMLKLTKPRRVSKLDNRTLWTRENADEDWDVFIEYARQDVVASRELFRYVRSYGWLEAEQETWVIDQEVNDRGWPLDTDMVSGAIRILNSETEHLKQRLRGVTGLANPNAHGQFSRWLESRSYPLPNLQKATVADALKKDSEAMPFEVRHALTLRSQLQRATPKKWQALERCAHEGAIKATLEFGAAQRTQRWGGRDFQPQNLYSARAWDREQLEALAQNIRTCSPQVFRFLYDDVQEALSAAIRPAVTAPLGHTLVVCDLSSIESRILGWLSGCGRINGLFASGRDTYKDLASRVFGVDYDVVSKSQRNYCKPPELGCGYMLGAKGLVAYAEGMGVDMSEDEALTIVRIWRASNPEVVTMWDWLQATTMTLIQGHASSKEGYKLVIRRDDDYLMVRLPSGRTIYYRNPRIVDGNYGPTVCYEGRNERTGGWGDIYTHPGKWTENIIQAVARDVLRDNVLRSSETWMPWASLIGHVHDEGVWLCRVSDAEKTLEAAEAMMSAALAWAPGLKLDAEGFVTLRYLKS
jgi:DNA polymerase